MSTSTFTQPDFPTQSATVYKTAIDDSVAVMKRAAAAFAVHEQATPDMTVKVDAGAIFDGVTLTEVAAQNTGTITAPTTDPRIDRVVIDRATGAVSVITGAEAASPSAPAITAGNAPVAQIALTTSMTEILNIDITDERELRHLGAVNAPHERKTDDYTALAADAGRLIEMDKATAVTLNLTAAATLGEGWFAYVKNSGVGTLTIDPNGAETIDDAATISFTQDESATVFCDGAAFWTVGKSSGGLPGGSVVTMLFYQDAAPVGWTKDTAATLDNSALRVVTSTAWASGKQGATAFSSVFGSSKTAGDTTLATSQIPSHDHLVDNAIGGSGFAASVDDGAVPDSDRPTSSTGGGSSHNHTLSLDLNYINMIIASKD